MKEAKLFRKVKRLLKRAKLPRWLHRFGPKLYELFQHVLALLLRELCKLSYRKVSNLLNGLGVSTPSYSALAKMAKRVPRALWNALFNATVGFAWTNVAAVDGTYYSRSSPSFHYLKRTNASPPRAEVQVNALLDARRKKWLSIVTRLKRVHESRDLPRLIQYAPPLNTLVADKASDSESVHRTLERDYHVQPHIPVRKGVKKGVYRKKHAACFRTRTYHRRSLIESAFSKNKRTQGQAIRNRLAKTIRTEITLRYTNDNLNLLAALLDIFNRALPGRTANHPTGW